MERLSWSLRAAADLEAIHTFIAQDSPRHAVDFIQRLVTFIETFPKQPQLGSIVAEYGLTDLRERAYKGYRIIYRIQSDRIQIVTLAHGARLLPETPPK